MDYNFTRHDKSVWRWLFLMCLIIDTLGVMYHCGINERLAIAVIVSGFFMIYNGVRLVSLRSESEIQARHDKQLSASVPTFWKQFLMGFIPSVYLIVLYITSVTVFSGPNISVETYQETLISLILILGLLGLLYCFIYFCTLRSLYAKIAIGGLLLPGLVGGLLYLAITIICPLSLLGSLFSLNTRNVLDLVLKINGLFLLMFGIIVPIILIKYEKRQGWMAILFGMLGIGFSLFYFYPVVVTGPLPQNIRPYTDSIYTKYTSIQIRGNKLIRQSGNQHISVVQGEPSGAHEMVFAHLRSSQIQPLDGNEISPFLFGKDYFITYGITSSGVQINKQSLDSYDKEPVQTHDEQLSSESNVSEESPLPQEIYTPQILNKVKLPFDKDMKLLFIKDVGETYQIQYVCQKQDFISSSENKGLEQSNRVRNNSELIKTGNIPSGDMSELVVKDVYVLDKNDLGIKNHYQFEPSYSAQTSLLILGNYLLKPGLHSTQMILIGTDTKHHKVAGELPVKVINGYMDGDKYLYLQTANHLLEIYDISDIRHPRKISMIPWSFRDTLVLDTNQLFELFMKDTRLIMWNHSGYYVVDVSQAEKPYLVHRRIVPIQLDPEKTILNWDPLTNSFHVITLDWDNVVFVGDYPPITK